MRRVIYEGVQGEERVVVDAPHTGGEVRVEPFPATVGTMWGNIAYVGAGDPPC